MATEYKLNFTADEINEKLANIGTKVELVYSGSESTAVGTFTVEFEKEYKFYIGVFNSHISMDARHTRILPVSPTAYNVGVYHFANDSTNGNTLYFSNRAVTATSNSITFKYATLTCIGSINDSAIYHEEYCIPVAIYGVGYVDDIVNGNEVAF